MGYLRKYQEFLWNDFKGSLKWGYFIFFVTTKCNESCKHCFYHEHLNQKEEMSLDEIEILTKKMGKTQVLLLSGGEPFLRKDLFEIVELFIRNAGVRVVSIPTNGLLKDRTISVTEKLADKYPSVTFSVNPSIDTLGEKNDEFRGKVGSFDKSTDTVKALTEIKLSRQNVEVVVNTVISNDNWKDMDEIVDYFKQFNITYHNFELLRGEPKEKTLFLPKLSEIQKIHRKALEARQFYIKRSDRPGLVERMAVLGAVAYSQSLKEEFLSTGKTSITCTAGENAVVVEPNKDVRLCELRQVVGNLSEFDYDINALLKSKKAVREREEVKDCSCTHICFLNTSIAKDKKSLMKIPIHYLKSNL